MNADQSQASLPTVCMDRSDMPTEVGSVNPRFIGNYKLLHRIGCGGMGEVWLAEQSSPIRRRVALKLIKSGMDSIAIIARFEAERQALAMMNHASIAKVFEGGTTSAGQPYLAMEFVDGLPITEHCMQHRLPLADRLRLFAAVCLAVQHAHQKGILHRDLKPTNILVSRLDQDHVVPKVIDFGLAKALQSSPRLADVSLRTEIGQVVGTLQYMSPEQAAARPVDIDTRSDIYSLGVLLYELLTGTTPIEVEDVRRLTMFQVLDRIRAVEPPRPSERVSVSAEALSVAGAEMSIEPRRLHSALRGELDWIIMKSIEKDPNRRYETASALADDVFRYLSHVPILARPPSTLYRIRKFGRKNRLLVTSACAVATALIVGIVGIGFALSEARKQTKTALAATEILASVFDETNLQKIQDNVEPVQSVLAERLVQASQSIEKNELGDPLTHARLKLRLGAAILSLGKPQAATKLLESANLTLASQLGAEELDSLKSTSYLADAYQALGRQSEAFPLYERTYEKAKSNPNLDVGYLLECKANLAIALYENSQIEKALPMLEQAATEMETKLGLDDYRTLQCKSNLGFVYQNSNRLDEAIELFREALNGQVAKLGPYHAQTLVSRNNLAHAYHVQGKFKEAFESLEQNYNMSKLYMGELHPQTLTSLGNLAQATISMQDFEKGGELLIRLADSNRQKYEDRPIAFANLLMSISEGLNQANQFSKVENVLRECLQIRLTEQPNVWTTSNTKSQLGAALSKQGKNMEAESLLMEGYLELKSHWNENPSSSKQRMIEALNRLVAHYSLTAQEEPLNRWKQELTNLSAQ